MPNPTTPKAPEKIFVKPGERVKTPLPVPGTSITVPAEGRSVVKSLAVIRLLRAGDLIDPKAEAEKATALAAAAKSAGKEG